LLGKLINSSINLYKDSTTLHKADIAFFIHTLSSYR